MKKFLSALLIVASMLLLCSCGVTDKKISENLKELEESKEISYSLLDKDDRDEIKEEIEEERYEKFKGEIEKGYELYSKTDYEYAIVLEFEKASDAKSAQKFLEDWDEIQVEKDVVVKCFGKIVVFGNEKLVKKITK